MRTRVGLWIGLALGGALGGLFLYRAELAPLMARRSGGERPSSKLARTLGPMRGNLPRSVPRPPSPAVWALPSDDSEDSEGPYAEAAKALLDQFRPDAFRERWEAETGDSPWAREFEGEVQAIFRGSPIAGARLVNVDCRATLCRIEVGFDSPEAYRKSVQVFSERAPLAGAKGRSEIEESRFVTYLAPVVAASPG